MLRSTMQNTIRWAIALALVGCASSQPSTQNPPSGDPGENTSERKSLPRAECEAQGGSVVGDIGDGATQRPDYVCPSGKRPIGTIVQPPGGPIAIEGEVCCPR